MYCLLGSRSGKELDALGDVQRRTRADRGLRPGDGEVLLEHEPALVPGGAERSDNLVDAGVSAAQWLEQTVLDGLHEAELPLPEALGDAGVDVLEVDVTDAVG